MVVTQVVYKRGSDNKEQWLHPFCKNLSYGAYIVWEELWQAYKTLNQFTKAVLKTSLLAQQCREITCVRFLVVTVAWMVYQFSGLCGCITEYFIPVVLRNVVISFSGSKWSTRMRRRMLSVWTFFLDSLTLGRWEHNGVSKCGELNTHWHSIIPQNDGYHTTRKCWKPHNHHTALCYATLQTILLPAKWVSKFSPICVIAFQFPQPGSFPCAW